MLPVRPSLHRPLFSFANSTTTADSAFKNNSRLRSISGFADAVTKAAPD